MKSLQEQVAIVTGGGSGIGRAAAIALAEQGARVVVGNRREDYGKETVYLIKDAGGEAVFQKTDVSNIAEVQALVQRAVNTFGRLDIAFNNAGIPGPIRPLVEQSEEDFDRTFDVNVKGVYLCMKYQIKQMLAQGGGVIVNNISTNGFRNSVPGLAIFTASKHAVVGLTKAAAIEYAQSGIRVNAVAPGPTRTDALVAEGDELLEKLTAMLPMKKMSNPEDIANAVVWLCSDAAAFVTGHTLVIDSGFLAQ
jgi:NAD(P)-dependent dehydrogenase (short-subunit alcohol dehydrogenase family)